MAKAEGEIVEEEELDAERDARRRLALAQIRQYPDPVLRMEARPVEEFDEELVRLVERMSALMVEAAGVGLAATQVGVLRRLFVFTPGGDEVVAVVNPQIANAGTRPRPTMRAVSRFRALPRPWNAPSPSGWKARTRRGAVSFDLEGYPARTAQHELDHLDGVLIVDRTTPRSAPRGPRDAAAPRRPQVAVARIAVAATAPFGADVFERLAARHEVVALLTRPDTPRGRGRKLAPPPAKVVAESLQIPVLQPPRLTSDVCIHSLTWTPSSSRPTGC